MSELSRNIHTNLIPQGKSRDIGQTEIKNITPDIMCKYIIPKLHMDILTMFPPITRNNASSYLSAIPGNELPWFSLVNNLYKAGQLERIVYQLRTLSNIVLPNCYDNPARASCYIGLSAFIVQESNPLVGTFVLLTNYKNTDILNHIHTYSLAILRRIITLLHPDIQQSYKLTHIDIYERYHI